MNFITRRQIQWLSLSLAAMVLAAVLFFILVSSNKPKILTEIGESSQRDANADIYMTPFNRVVTKDGQVLYEIHAEAAELFLEGLFRLKGIKPLTSLVNRDGTKFNLMGNQGIWDKNKGILKIQGEAEISSDRGYKISASEITYDSEKKTISAPYKLNLETDNSMVSAYGLVVDIEKEAAVAYPEVEGKLFKTGDPEKISCLASIHSTRLNLDNRTRQMVFWDGARLQSLYGEVLSDRVEVTFKPEKNQIDRVIIGEDVEIRGKNCQGSCGIISLAMDNGSGLTTGTLLLDKNPYFSFKNFLKQGIQEDKFFELLGSFKSDSFSLINPINSTESKLSELKADAFTGLFYGEGYQTTLKMSTEILPDELQIQASSISMQNNLEWFMATGGFLLRVNLQEEDLLEASSVDFVGKEIKLTGQHLFYDLQQKQLICQDNIKLSSEREKISADRLEVFFDENRKPLKLNFLGKVFSLILPEKDPQKIEKTKKYSHRPSVPIWGSSLKNPLEIRADTFTVDIPNNKASYKERVWVGTEEGTLTADRIDIDYNPSKTDVDKITALGQVQFFQGDYSGGGGKLEVYGHGDHLYLEQNPYIRRGAESIKAEKISYDKASGILQAEENVQAHIKSKTSPNREVIFDSTKPDSETETSSEWIDIYSQRLEYNLAQDRGSFQGEVRVVQNNAVLTAKEINFYQNPESKEISSLEANGEVILKDKEKHATAQKAVFVAEEQKIILSGEPKIWQEDKLNSEGNRIIFLLNESRFIIEGDSRQKTTTVLHRKKSSNDNDKKESSP